MNDLTSSTNILCIVGGTGITFVLPVLLELVSQSAVRYRRIDYVWAVRRDADVLWEEQGLHRLRAVAVSHTVDVRSFGIRETGP